MNAAAATARGANAEPAGALPRISIVVTCADAVHLEETLGSVLDQDYPALECIVIDRSTAGDSLQESAVGGCRLEKLPGAGRAEAFQHGVARAGGEIVGWLEGGDICNPGTLREVATAFADPAVGIAASERFGVIDDDGLCYAIGHNSFENRERLIRCWETGGTTIHQPGLFLRRRLLADEGLCANPAPVDAIAYELALRISRAATVTVVAGRWTNRRRVDTQRPAAWQSSLNAACQRHSRRHGGSWLDPARCRRLFASLDGSQSPATAVDCAALPPPRFDVDADYRVRSAEPLVTALICNFNYAPYLAAAIDSALSQSYGRVEVLVVDDGSTDESRRVLSGYGDRIRVLLKDNGGQASAFNAGIAAARGEIVCFLDSDDVWRRHKVACVVEKYREAPWGLLCHDLTVIDASGGVATPGPDWSVFQGVCLGSGEVFDAVTAAGFAWLFCPTSGMSLPTALARRFFPLPEPQWRISADLPIAYAAISEAPLGLLEQSLAGYRLHGANGFSMRLQDPVEGLLIGLIDPARRCLFLRRHLARSGRVLGDDPRQDYRYFRRCCFVAGRSPWRRLPELWRRNLRHHLRRPDGHHGPHPRLAAGKFLLLDTLIALAIGAGVSARYGRLRAAFRKAAERLDEQTRDFLVHARSD